VWDLCRQPILNTWFNTEIMAIYNEIKQLMRWGFATLLAIASLVVAVLRLMP